MIIKNKKKFGYVESLKTCEQKNKNTELSSYVVTEQSLTMIDDGLFCFCCGQNLGSYHKNDCDRICKDVKIRAAVEYYILVPGSWGEDEIKEYASLITGGLYFNYKLIFEKILKLNAPYPVNNMSGEVVNDCRYCANWRNDSRVDDCGYLCKNVTIGAIMELGFTVPSIWENKAIAEYAELEALNLGLRNFKFKKVVEEHPVYFDEDFCVRVFK